MQVGTAEMTARQYVVEYWVVRACLRAAASRQPRKLRARVREGLPYRSFESVRERLGLSTPETARVLHTPARTLARRRQARQLDPGESDRLYRIARLAAHAVSTFGEEEKAAAWLRRPNRALNGEAPIHLLDTDVGTQEIDDILGRIEHGIVA